MATVVKLNEEQKATLRRLMADHENHPDPKPKVALSITADQRDQIKSATGQDFSILELTELDLKQLAVPAAYENGLTVNSGGSS